MNFSVRVKGILLRPREEWMIISDEKTSVADLYRGYLVVLAAIGPIAAMIGMALVGITLPFVGTIRVPIVSAVTNAIVQYVLMLAGVYVLALVIDSLAPTFGGEKNFLQSFKLSAYSYTPGLLAGIFAIIPALSVLGILGLYGLYLLYIGIPLLKKSPQEKSLGYTIAVVIAAIVIFVIIGLVSRAFISYPAPSIPPMRGM